MPKLHSFSMLFAIAMKTRPTTWTEINAKCNRSILFGCWGNVRHSFSVWYVRWFKMWLAERSIVPTHAHRYEFYFSNIPKYVAHLQVQMKRKCNRNDKNISKAQHLLGRKWWLLSMWTLKSKPLTNQNFVCRMTFRY